MSKFLSLLVSFSILILMACGDGVSGGLCNEKVVNDHNHIVQKCDHIAAFNIAECVQMVDAFLKKYPKVNCRGQKAYEVNESYLMISRQYMEKMKEDFKKKVAKN